MKVYQVIGWPSSLYFVETRQEFSEIMAWMGKNNVGYLHEYSGLHGYGFSIKKNFEWFALRWL